MKENYDSQEKPPFISSQTLVEMEATSKQLASLNGICWTETRGLSRVCFFIAAMAFIISRWALSGEEGGPARYSTSRMVVSVDLRS